MAFVSTMTSPLKIQVPRYDQQYLNQFLELKLLPQLQIYVMVFASMNMNSKIMFQGWLRVQMYIFMRWILGLNIDILRREISKSIQGNESQPFVTASYIQYIQHIVRCCQKIKLLQSLQNHSYLRLILGQNFKYISIYLKRSKETTSNLLQLLYLHNKNTKIM